MRCPFRDRRVTSHQRRTLRTAAVPLPQWYLSFPLTTAVASSSGGCAMRHERSSSTAVVIVVGLAALVQGFMPPPAPLLTARISAGSSRASTARPESTAASVTSCSTSRLSRTIACAAADSSTELLLDLENTAADGTPDRAPAAAAVEAGGGLEASGEGAEQEEEGKGEGDDNEEDSGWVEDSAELLSKGAGAIGAGVKSVALASKPLKREPSGRLVPDGQGLLNLCILIFSGLWAVHSIVTVDSASWRGWTVQETLIRLPWDNWDSYESGLQEHPIITKTGINVGIYLIGDWLSQVNWGREEDVALYEFDLQRTLRNGLIGAFFGPLVHYYYDFSDWILPPNVGTNRPLKIMLDQSIYFVSKCAMYISLVSLLRGDSLEETRETVNTRLKGVVTTGWRFWPFVHIFTYFLIPPRHRVLWVNCVDLLWSSILAGLTSGTPVEVDPVDPSEGEGGGGVACDAAVEGAVASSGSAPGGVSAAAAAATAAAVEKRRAQA